VREEGCNELVRVCVSELLDCREQLQREGETDQAAQAKKTVADAATPKPEDKGLSEQATDALPAKASDTAASVTDSAKSTTPDAHSGEPASPSILGKIGGLFGFGAAKAPEDHSQDAAH
jgi:uncharacterized membrane protein